MTKKKKQGKPKPKHKVPYIKRGHPYAPYWFINNMVKEPKWVWASNGKTFTRDEHYREYYGFIYQVTFIDGKMYVGRRVFDSWGHWKYYVGSGRRVTDRLKANGWTNRGIIKKREIIETVWGKEEMWEIERNYIKSMNCVEDDMFLNIYP